MSPPTSTVAREVHRQAFPSISGFRLPATGWVPNGVAMSEGFLFLRCFNWAGTRCKGVSAFGIASRRDRKGIGCQSSEVRECHVEPGEVPLLRAQGDGLP